MSFESGIGAEPVVLSGAGGLNLSVHQADIETNELSICFNMWFEASSGRLVTRTGLDCVSVAPVNSPIEVLHPFIRKDTEGYIVGSAGDVLYYFNFQTLQWVYLAPLNSDLPQMKSFNGNLYVADGSSGGILKWNGTDAPERLVGSPQATALYLIQNRLVANSIADAELDAVYLSAVESDSFDTTTDGGLIIRAGYGDGQRVNGFSSISSTLIVSKVAYVDDAPTKKNFYGIDMSSSDPSGWIADYVSRANAAIGPHALAGYNQDVVYLDSQGLEALTPTQEYGDIATDPAIGGKVNNQIAPYTRAMGDRGRVIAVSNLATIAIIVGSKIFTLSNLTGTFTELSFETPINYIINYGDDVYLAGYSGHLYKLGPESGEDEISPGVFAPYISKTRFKMMQGSGQILLTRSHFDISYLNSGSYKVSAVSGEKIESTVLQIVDFETPTGSAFLYDANGQLADANYDLGSEGTQRRIPCRSKFRGDGIAVEIMTYNKGRISIGKATLNFANVGR